MLEQRVVSSREREIVPSYRLKVNQEFLHFKKVIVTKFDETKPWKPAVTISVEFQDGNLREGLDAQTPFFTFQDTDGKEITVSGATAGHIFDVHFSPEDSGSKFDEPDLLSLFQDIAQRMPAGKGAVQGIDTFSLHMEKRMGTEGIASLTELVQDNVLKQEDIDDAMGYKEEVQRLNREGDKGAMKEFVEDYSRNHPQAKVLFRHIRTEGANSGVIVPHVLAPKRPTNQLFVMIGPNETSTGRALFTVAPGRNMPRHPMRGQHIDRETGELDEKTFQESADAWFSTVMLVAE